MTSLPPQFDIRVVTLGSHSVRVEVEGEVDMATSPEFGRTLEREVLQGKSVVVDFSKTEFMDSSGINTLMQALRLCERNGGKLAVMSDVPSQIARLFEIAGLSRFLPTVGR